jgi:hypothetical protein
MLFYKSVFFKLDYSDEVAWYQGPYKMWESMTMLSYGFVDPGTSFTVETKTLQAAYWTSYIDTDFEGIDIEINLV